ncbi:MAG: hypothetical protein EZS28_009280 [Streblomastix strix]|uniref:Uncharacterized protein n=1 Tax=Streblomastix strix TaxID=222440 RepID=A0A5J4WK18_9EUKA|nr:MAG: hypothetical protein EZS28_009280 [Streblomastix strix]
MSKNPRQKIIKLFREKPKIYDDDTIVSEIEKLTMQQESQKQQPSRQSPRLTQISTPQSYRDETEASKQKQVNLTPTDLIKQLRLEKSQAVKDNQRDIQLNLIRKDKLDLYPQNQKSTFSKMEEKDLDISEDGANTSNSNSSNLDSKDQQNSYGKIPISMVSNFATVSHAMRLGMYNPEFLTYQSNRPNSPSRYYQTKSIPQHSPSSTQSSSFIRSSTQTPPPYNIHNQQQIQQQQSQSQTQTQTMHQSASIKPSPYIQNNQNQLNDSGSQHLNQIKGISPKMNLITEKRIEVGKQIRAQRAEEDEQMVEKYKKVQDNYKDQERLLVPLKRTLLLKQKEQDEQERILIEKEKQEQRDKQRILESQKRKEQKMKEQSELQQKVRQQIQQEMQVAKQKELKKERIKKEKEKELQKEINRRYKEEQEKYKQYEQEKKEIIEKELILWREQQQQQQNKSKQKQKKKIIDSISRHDGGLSLTGGSTFSITQSDPSILSFQSGLIQSPKSEVDQLSLISQQQQNNNNSDKKHINSPLQNIHSPNNLIISHSSPISQSSPPHQTHNINNQKYEILDLSGTCSSKGTQISSSSNKDKQINKYSTHDEVLGRLYQPPDINNTQRAYVEQRMAEEQTKMMTNTRPPWNAGIQQNYIHYIII